MMEFKFKNVRNGILLEAKAFDGEVEEVVYQEEFDENSEIETFAQFLRLIDEYYGPSTSRYSEKRIRVLIAPGDKLEGVPDKESAEEALKWFEENEPAKPSVRGAFLAGWAAAKHDH